MYEVRASQVLENYPFLHPGTTQGILGELYNGTFRGIRKKYFSILSRECFTHLQFTCE